MSGSLPLSAQCKHGVALARNSGSQHSYPFAARRVASQSATWALQCQSDRKDQRAENPAAANTATKEPANRGSSYSTISSPVSTSSTTSTTSTSSFISKASKDPVAAAASPALLFGALGVFSLTAWDVFHPSSLHLLRNVDQGAHLFVVNHLDSTARQLFADVIASDTFIALALLGWVSCTVAAFLSKQPLTMGAMIVAWTIYAWGAGPIQYDPFVVDLAKNVFERQRPNALYHHSFSFPSGHTSSVSFTTGALLFVLLPMVLGSKEEVKQQQQQQSQKDSSTHSMHNTAQQVQQSSGSKNGLPMGEHQPGNGLPQAPSPSTIADVQQQSQQQVQQVVVKNPRVTNFLRKIQGSWTVWALACGVTATGRVLADAHWVSDTIAATCLGAASVSVLAQFTLALRNRAQQVPVKDPNH